MAVNRDVFFVTGICGALFPIPLRAFVFRPRSW